MTSSIRTRWYLRGYQKDPDGEDLVYQRPVADQLSKSGCYHVDWDTASHLACDRLLRKDLKYYIEADAYVIPGPTE